MEGTYGDREVHLCRCMPKHPNGINVILLHGVHSSANLSYHNKFRYLAEILTEKGLTPWLVETSRRIRNRQELKDNITAWIKGASVLQVGAFRGCPVLLDGGALDTAPLWRYGIRE